jgi:hypothetical protein
MRLRRAAARLDERLGGIIPLALKLGVVALVWGAAYLDYKEPGLGKFYDPLPWHLIDQVRGDFGICPEVDGAMTVPFAQGLAEFINSDTSLEGIQRRLGKPICHIAKDQVYVFRLSSIFGQELMLKAKFNDQNKATNYEILRKGK